METTQCDPMCEFEGNEILKRTVISFIFFFKLYIVINVTINSFNKMQKLKGNFLKGTLLSKWYSKVNHLSLAFCQTNGKKNKKKKPKSILRERERVCFVMDFPHLDTLNKSRKVFDILPLK